MRRQKVRPHTIKAQRTAAKTRNTIYEISIYRPLTTNNCVLVRKDVFRKNLVKCLDYKVCLQKKS